MMEYLAMIISLTHLFYLLKIIILMNQINILYKEFLKFYIFISIQIFVIIKDDTNNSNYYLINSLNSLNLFILPPFSLELKIGCPIMLLRNIDWH